MEGKKVKDEFVEYEYFMNVTVDVNDRLQPGKYKIHSEFKYKE